MANGQRRGRSGLILGAIVVLGLLWIGYWYAAHYVAEAAIARLTSAPVNGKTVACAGIDIGGFPLRLDVNCARGSYAEAGNQVTGELAGVRASAPLYRPGLVEATLEAPMTLNIPALGVALTATWTDGAATGSAGLGGLNGAGASFSGLRIENSGQLPGLPVEAIAADAASGAINPAGGGSSTLVGSMRRLSLTRADGSKFPDVDADADVTLVNLGQLGKDPARAILGWLRGTPNATIQRVRLAMAGAIISVSGTLSLSAQGLLSGSILLRYNGVDALANLIETLKPGTRDHYAVPLQALQAMSKAIDTEDGAMQQTTLTFTDGAVWLTIFPLPIEPIPPIRF